MNFDEFEEKLRRQPRREIPAHWREDILRPLRATTAAHPWWRQWLWPHPAAWASLAAMWVAVFALQFAARPEAGTPSVASSQSRSEILQALAERTRLMAELSAEPNESRPSPVDRPRSARPNLQAAV
jgi:hypothetical protein